MNFIFTTVKCIQPVSTPHIGPPLETCNKWASLHSYRHATVSTIHQTSGRLAIKPAHTNFAKCICCWNTCVCTEDAVLSGILCTGWLKSSLLSSGFRTLLQYVHLQHCQAIASAVFRCIPSLFTLYGHCVCIFDIQPELELLLVSHCFTADKPPSTFVHVHSLGVELAVSVFSCRIPNSHSKCIHLLPGRGPRNSPGRSKRDGVRSATLDAAFLFHLHDFISRHLATLTTNLQRYHALTLSSCLARSCEYYQFGSCRLYVQQDDELFHCIWSMRYVVRPCTC